MPAPKTPTKSLKPVVNRKVGLYVMSAIGLLIVIAFGTLLLKSNPKAVQAKAKQKAALAAAKQLRAGTASQAQSIISQRLERLQEAAEASKAAAKQKAALIAQKHAQAAIATTAGLPPTNAMTLKQLEDAFNASHKPGSPLPSHFGGGSSESHGGGRGSDRLGLEPSGAAQKHTKNGDYEDYAPPASASSTTVSSTGVAKGGKGTYSALSTLKPPHGALVPDGTVIRAVLLFGIDTRNPGNVKAIVTQNVYSLATGAILIPKGTTLLGSYQTAVSPGLPRIPVAFKTMIFANGREVNLGNMAAVNYAGEVGVPGKYHSNILRALGPSLLVDLIGTGIDRLNDKQQNSAELGTGTAIQAPSVTEQIAPQVNNEVMSRYGNAQPYFIVKAGTAFKIVTSSPIVLPWGNPGSTSSGHADAGSNAPIQTGVWQGGGQP
ncbi:MAG TPA: TrbI/VirB10 family protein [Nevskiaceae bacterium]|nr:TrbI/VirB10 family protein [Nevskiaceae bacterium]